MAAAGVPQKLKAIAHYIKIANEYSNRDPAVYYWSLLYGVQKGMEIDKSSPECKQFLVQNLGLLEQIKQQNKTNEAITNEVVASAHVEECALKLFVKADTDDRAGRFDKNVVKSFYTAAYLFDVLNCFGEVDTQILQQQKYAKWKSAYIHNCLRNGQTPVSGPIAGEGDDDGGFGDFGTAEGGAPSNLPPPPVGFNIPVPPSNPAMTMPPITPASNQIPPAAAASSSSSSVTVGGNENNLQPADMMKAQKFCKYAISALEYEDVNTAVNNLQQALDLLQLAKK